MSLSRSDINLGPTSRRWQGLQEVEAANWVCGFCGDQVSSKEGWYIGEHKNGLGTPISFIRICPSCHGPTFFTRHDTRYPSNAPGQPVPNVPIDLADLYNEARVSAGAGAYTASVLACRKILMHVAVDKGAKPKESFVYYVEYLAEKNYLTPDGKDWVDYIRRRGNEANHEIVLMDEEDAEALITFVEMLLRHIYDFPMRVPKPKGTDNAPSS